MKTCSICGEEKPLEEFCKGKNQCKACKAEYNRKWYAANREKVIESQRKYYAANSEKALEYNRKWYAANREKIAERARKYRAANRKKITETDREYRAANPEKIAERKRKWSAANREKIAEKSRKWYEANRNKVACHKIAQGYNTLAVHKLDTCMVCGYKHGEIYRTGRPGRVEKHHWSYAAENANDVFPLCPLHHNRIGAAIRKNPLLKENKMLQYAEIMSMREGGE